MQWLKFNVVISLFLSLSVFADTKFSSLECFNANFKMDVKAQEQLFGLLKNTLKIDKDKCVLKISQKRVLETEWLVDVCREPIHMKVTSKGSQSVYKRLTGCERDSKRDFCDSWKELKTLIEDRGLIYAEGQREILGSDHGKVYCSYLILKKYLDEGVLFSVFDTNINLYNETSKVSPFELKAPSESIPVSPKPSMSSPISEPKEMEGQF